MPEKDDEIVLRIRFPAASEGSTQLPEYAIRQAQEQSSTWNPPPTSVLQVVLPQDSTTLPDAKG